MRRKLFCITLLLMAGILAASWLGLRVLSLLFPVLLYLAKNHVQTRGYLLVFVFGMVMFLGFQLRFSHGLYYPENGISQEMLVKGVVVDIEQKEEESYRLTIDADGEKMLAAYYQKLEAPWALMGKEISFQTEIMLPEKAGNPRTFDYRQYLLTRSIQYTCIIDAYTVVNSKVKAYYRLKQTIMEKRDDFFQQLSASDQSAAILRGVLFGDKNQIGEDVYEAFRKNGTAHVLAVSGLHVGMLYSIYRWIYGRWKRAWITAVFIGVLLLYGTAALWSVSVTRAIGLIVLAVLGRNVDRRYDLLTALSAMAIFSMVRNPYVIFAAGFQMSFLAVLSITFLQRPFRKYVGEKWAVAFAVQVGLLPYMAYTFNYVSFVGILCNIPVIFLASILVPVGMAGFLCYFLFGIWVPGVGALLERLSHFMIWCNEQFLAEGILSFDVVSPPLWLVAMIYGILFFCTSEYFHIYFHRKAWKRIAIAFVLIGLCSGGVFLADRTPFDQADLVFVDVGQGDCVHIKVSRKTQVLIDGGGKLGYSVGEKVLKPYLLKNGIGEINLAAATHLHTDHYAGLQELVGCFPVKNVLTEGNAGETIRLGKDFWIEILWPLEAMADSDDENLNSLIYMVHHKGKKTLITGDITAEGEAMLLDAWEGTEKLQADVLKIAHHGSAYSTSDAFLQAVNPQVAVICVGQNHYGHPSDIVVEKLVERGIMVFRTDLDGAVGIINRKGTISVCTEKQR